MVRHLGPRRSPFRPDSADPGPGLVLVYALTRVTLIVIPVLIALILAVAIAPLVAWLRHRGWPAAAATGVSFLGMLAVFGGMTTGIVFAVRDEWPTLVAKAGAGFDQLYALVKTGPFPVDDAAIQDARDKALEFLGSSAFTSGAITGLGTATQFATGFVLMAVVLFYFLKDGQRIWAFVLRAFTGGRRAKAELAGARSLQVLGGYVRGTAAVAGADAVVIGGAPPAMQVPRPRRSVDRPSSAVSSPWSAPPPPGPCLCWSRWSRTGRRPR